MAQTLFEEGRTAMKKGDYAKACPMLEESQRRDPGGGTLLNLALCHEQLGKIATAWTEYNDAYAQASRERRTEREKIAKEHLDALGPRLPKITIRVPKSSPDEKVTLDGSPVNSAAFGVPLPVDPGEHVVAASAPDRQSWSSQVTAKEKGAIDVSVPDLALAVGTDPCADPNAGCGGLGLAQPPAAQPQFLAHNPNFHAYEYAPTKPNPLKTGLALAGVAGIIGATVGGSLLLVYGIEYKSAKCNTGRSYCPSQDGIDAADNARTWSYVTLASLGVTVAAFVTIAFLPSSSSTDVTIGPGNAMLRHRF